MALLTDDEMLEYIRNLNWSREKQTSSVLPASCVDRSCVLAMDQPRSSGLWTSAIGGPVHDTAGRLVRSSLCGTGSPPSNSGRISCKVIAAVIKTRSNSQAAKSRSIAR